MPYSSPSGKQYTIDLIKRINPKTVLDIGWQPAPEPPTNVPADKELVWLNWEWIIRDPKPADRAGYQWNWNHADRTWVESAWQTSPSEAIPITIPEVLTTSQVSNLTTAQLI